MALPVLDGNQSATTLSSVVTGGEHIVAHSVVCFGSTAIANITNAVSGSVVSISNFPSTQTIAGTVTVGNATTASAVAVRLIAEDTNPGGSPAGVNVNLYSNDNALLVDAMKNGNSVLGYDGLSSYVQVKPAVGSSVTIGSLPAISGTVTVGNSVTVGSLPAISGTVTANVPLLNNTAFYVSGADVDTIRTVIYSSANGDFGDDEGAPVDSLNPLPVFVKNEISGTVTVGNSVTIAGTVTANLADQQTDSGTPIFVAAYVNSPGGSAIPVSQDPGAGMPVSGTVIVGAMPNGSLTTRFGTPTTASVAFATTAVTNASRKYLLIQNVTTGSNVITVGIGFTPTTTQGIQLTAGAGITFESSYIPTGAVRILSSVTASNFTILEG